MTVPMALDLNALGAMHSSLGSESPSRFDENYG